MLLASTPELANTPAAQVRLPDSTGPPRLQLPSAASVPGHQLARVTLTVSEVAGVLGISRTKAYEAVAAGSIPSVKIGRRLLVPVAAFYTWLSAASAPPPIAASTITTT
jgi:excisionase family DNA binding protein